MKFIIYHNPNWSKSRQSLELLRSKKADTTIVEYLKNPPSKQTLKILAQKLNLSPNEFLRKNDKRYKELSLAEFNGTEDDLIKIIHDNPRILERPIIETEEHAVIGRPPENILELFQ